MEPFSSAVEELVFACLERIADEGESAVDALCREHPEHAANLRRRIAELRRLGLCREPAVTDEPQRIGEYRILRRLGSGGMGVVYLAEQERLHRLVALKLLRPGPLRQERARIRFRREIDALTRIDHPNLCAVHDAGETDGVPYLAMRYVAGTTLAARIDAARRERAASIAGSALGCLGVIEKVARALHAAHEAGVVHRDVKPANIMFDERDEPVVLDFGLARDEQPGDARLTMTADQVGTPCFMAPEQIDGAVGPIDRRSDVYQLGVTAYESLTLRSPFAAPSRESLYRAILAGEVSDPRLLERTAGREVAAVVGRAMARDPRHRFSTALELADELERIRLHRPILTRRPGPLLRTVHWCQRNRVVAASLATLALGVVVASGFAIALQRRTAEFRMLANLLRLEEARAEESRLYPGWPEQLGDLERWLEKDAAVLCAELPALREAVRTLEAKALPQSAADAEELRRLDFADDADRYLHGRLSALVAEIESFEREQVAGVRERIGWAERIGQLTVSHPNATVTWEEARAAIALADGVVASERYRAHPIDLRPQWGLVPIGRNPKTGLWEFYHLRSAWDPASGFDAIERLPIPAHRPDGTIAVDGDTGIVFVLIPGGTFRMGAQNDDPADPNHDPYAKPDETPVDVTLAPFFVARHELTRGQWRRLAGAPEPGFYELGLLYADATEAVGPAHPVESVTAPMCDELLARHGLVLPTEAQWEYGCRAGTTTAWLCGDDPSGMPAYANLDYADLEERRRELRPAPSLCRVGARLANDFGLFDTAGNVSEWCADRYGDLRLPYRRGDGFREPSLATPRVSRGGSHNDPPLEGRSARRPTLDSEASERTLGLRAVRSLADGGEADASQWIRRTSREAPPPRFWAAMAWDAGRQRAVLFGGTDSWAENGPYRLFGDTWEWDGVTWRQRSSNPSPPARSLHAMAYDRDRRRVVLFGGGHFGLGSGDTWEWDGDTWRLVCAEGEGPPARWGHAMAYDAARRQVVMIGPWGAEGEAVPPKTWLWDGSTWAAHECETPTVNGSPPLTYDAARQRLVMLQGALVWEWDGRAWSAVRPAVYPQPERDSFGQAYDAARGRMVMFGGDFRGVHQDNLADTWEWDGLVWTRRDPGLVPPGRYGAAMVFDEARGHVVLFGGYRWEGPASGPERGFSIRTVMQDTWEYVDPR